jgi:hypothetical protein
MEVSGQLQVLWRFTPGGKGTLYSLYRELGGPQSRSGPYGEQKNLAPAGNQTRAVQSAAHRYTDSKYLLMETWVGNGKIVPVLKH